MPVSQVINREYGDVEYGEQVIVGRHETDKPVCTCLKFILCLHKKNQTVSAECQNGTYEKKCAKD